MKVLITGASGRFGPFVIKELESDHELVLFSRRKPPEEALGDHPWIQGDLVNYEDVRKAVKGVEAIQHLGAQPFPTDHPGQQRAVQERGLAFDTTMKSNIIGTYNVLQAAAEEGVRVVVMAGSNCSLGHGYRISKDPFPIKYLPIDEEHPSDVEDSYSYSKLVGEEMLRMYTRAFGMRTYALRLAGICQPPRVQAIADNAKPVAGWSDWMWAWVASVDAARAHRLLMEKALDEGSKLPLNDYYFCNGDDSNALEPSMELVERFRPDLVPLVRELKGNQSLLSNGKLKAAVGWEHKSSWRALRAKS